MTHPRRAAVILAIAYASVGAQEVNLYSDPSFTNKEAFDAAPGTLTVYVVLENHPGATSASLRITPNAGFTGVWLGETVEVDAWFGTSPTGIATAFGGCMVGPVHLLTITYAMTGTSAGCSYLEVVLYPLDFIRICDCSVICVFVYHGKGGRLIVNPDGKGCTVAVDQSTWGKIKALYNY